MTTTNGLRTNNTNTMKDPEAAPTSRMLAVLRHQLDTNVEEMSQLQLSVVIEALTGLVCVDGEFVASPNPQNANRVNVFALIGKLAEWSVKLNHKGTASEEFAAAFADASTS